MFKKSLILTYLLLAFLFSLNVRANITGAMPSEVSVLSYEYNAETMILAVRGQYNTECDHNLRPRLSVENDELVMYFTADGFANCAVSFSEVFEHQVNLPNYLEQFSNELPNEMVLRLRDTSFKISLTK